jgi:hypothetical protein
MRDPYRLRTLLVLLRVRFVCLAKFEIAELSAYGHIRALKVPKEIPNTDIAMNPASKSQQLKG